MKKFFYLMSVVCLMMAASCEKPENGNNEKPQTEPPVVTVPEGVKTAGAELVLKAEGLVEGRKEGLIEGRKEGRQEGKLEIARMMLSDGEPMEKIMTYTGLTKQEITQL